MPNRRQNTPDDMQEPPIDVSTERRYRREREATLKLLSLLNSRNRTRELVQDVTGFLQQWTGCEAVGVRLRDGDDFPYFETRGFPPDFVQAENSLCERDLNGQLLHDSVGNPVLECMCGNVLCGRFNPALPFLTAKGSFWTNSTTELLATTTEAERQARTRNRCHGEGYESVALFRLASGGDTLGLLQLCDRAQGRFTPEILAFLENAAEQIAIALAQRLGAAALLESRERYRYLYENMLNGLAYCRMLFEQGRPLDFIYLDVNGAFETLTGLKNVVGRKVTEVIPGIRASDPDLFEIYGRVALSGTPERFERYVRALGMWFSIAVYSPKKEHFVAVFDVITERKRAEEDLRAANARLEKALAAAEELAARAEAASVAKSQFLGNMSHEIRTPMTAIVGFADLLRIPDLPVHEQREFVEGIRRNANLLLQLINDVLDLARVEAGKLSVRPVACSPREVAQDVIAMLVERAARKGVGLELECEESAPAAIRTDPTRLRQILVNLVGNAIKFTERGLVRLDLRCPRGAARLQVQFVVADTGIGIAEDAIAELFEPFTQIDASSTRRYGGSGLGLALSRRLARSLGGDIAVASKLGEGSTFTLTIDAGEIATEPVPPVLASVSQSSAKRPGPAPPEILSSRVLLVEDCPAVQAVLQHMLRSLGVRTEVAEDGEVACRRARESLSEGRPFDLIFMDIQMPILDGLEATRRLRREGWRGPIVALTAHAMVGDRERCLEAGCDDYVAKPVSQETLTEVVDRCLRRRAADGDVTPGEE